MVNPDTPHFSIWVPDGMHDFVFPPDPGEAKVIDDPPPCGGGPHFRAPIGPLDVIPPPHWRGGDTVDRPRYIHSPITNPRSPGGGRTSLPTGRVGRPSPVTAEDSTQAGGFSGPVDSRVVFRFV